MCAYWLADPNGLNGSQWNDAVATAKIFIRLFLLSFHFALSRLNAVITTEK